MSLDFDILYKIPYFMLNALQNNTVFGRKKIPLLGILEYVCYTVHCSVVICSCTVCSTIPKIFQNQKFNLIDFLNGPEISLNFIRDCPGLFYNQKPLLEHPRMSLPETSRNCLPFSMIQTYLGGLKYFCIRFRFC